MNQILIGIDVGTTRIKTVATNTNLELLGELACITPWKHHKNLSEIDLIELANTVIATTSKLASQINGKIVAIGITGISETGALIDRSGVPLTPALAWHDPRGITEPIISELGDFEFRARAGTMISSVASIAKTLWLNKEYPSSKKANHFLSIPEWVAYKLTGNIVNELSLISRSGFFDVHTKSPWLEAVQLVGGDENFLGRLVTAGESVGVVNDQNPENLRGAVVTIAGHDHITAAHYCGGIQEGCLVDSLGTAEAILWTFTSSLSKNAVAELASANIGLSCSVVADHYTLMGGLPTGLTLERACALLGISTLSEKIELGRRALLLDPSTISMQVANNYYGLSISNLDDAASPAALFYAVTEHLIEDSQTMIDLIERFTGPASQVVITGGWAKNPLIAAAKLRQFGSYRTSEVAEAGAMGAAQFAGLTLTKSSW